MSYPISGIFSSSAKLQMNTAPVPGSRPVQALLPAGKAKRGGGCARQILIGCLVGLFAVILVCGVVGIGGFLAYRAGVFTPRTVLNLVGLGPGDIEIDNFRDDTIEVSVLQLDVASDSTPTQTSLEIHSFDIQSYLVQQPGRYQVDFGTTVGGADLGTCTITIKSGDKYQFVPLPDKIVINRVNHPVSVGSDLIVATSTLCR